MSERGSVTLFHGLKNAFFINKGKKVTQRLTELCKHSEGHFFFFVTNNYG